MHGQLAGPGSPVVQGLLVARAARTAVAMPQTRSSDASR